MPRKNPAAVALGRRGGQTTSTAKAEAARANGANGGRPEAPLNMYAIRAAAAVSEWLAPQDCGETLSRMMDTREWVEQLARVIQRSARAR